MSQTSNISLILLSVLMLVLNFKNIISVIGTGAIIAIIIFIVVSFVLAFFMGGPGSDTKRVLGLGTAQRNLSAALVGSQNFDDPNVVIMIIVASLLMLFILMPIAGEIGKRSKAT
jgi:BASS family bile acid:Na+ symporter